MTGAEARTAGLVAVLTGALGFVAAVGGGLVAAAGSSGAGVGVRAVLVTLVLVVVPSVVLRRVPAARRRIVALAALAAGYVLTLGWWAGQVYAARLVLDDALPAALLDLVLWTAVGVVAVGRAPRRDPAPRGSV